MRPILLVIYTSKLEECRSFYASLGLDLTAEQHGDGPRHFAAVLADGGVLELYPATSGRETGALRLGFSVDRAASLPSGVHVLRDPDGRAVELHVSGQSAM
ncbi:VOC family protein [Planotetraspora sp. A-T 1434]|uniref:VOC family protein n=1 Tax=Planotetraspora sp. A-T 1434 TaxID=2979219 RepID=UPI0021C0C541|nr:VOC family protein [Planotetraspora sp. A-T 1434]MCT9934379.1 VOC family protein [Planotetraspora sp. A-T 1434]